MFNPSEYIVPKTVAETVKMLYDFGDRAKIIAGGTMIYELAKKGMIPKIEKLIDVRDLGLDKVQVTSDGITIGSTVTVNDLASMNIFEPGFEVVREALSKIEPEQVRNVATVGGEVCGSTPFFDLPPALIAADARLKIEGPKGERTISIENFYLDYLLTDLRRGELLTEVFLPKPPRGSGSCFLKYSRTEFDFPVVNVGMRLVFDKEGKCLYARIGLCGISPIPKRATKIEDVLRGKKINESVIKSAISLVDDYRPVSKVHASSWFKKHIAKLMLRDGLKLSAMRGGLVL